MRLLSRLHSLVHRIFHRQDVDNDLDDEIRCQLELMAVRKIKEGMKPEEAWRTAKIELGGVEQVKERVRAVRTGAWLDSLVQDIRFALRMLRKNPGFTAVAVLTLALGIGANTAIFSVVNAVLLKGLPFPKAGRIAVLGDNAGPILNTLADSPNQFLSWQSHVQSFEAATAYQPGDVNLTGAGEPESIHAAQVTRGFFEVFAVAPLLGRDFQAAQNTAANGVILSWNLWKSRYSGDTRIVGKAIEINTHAVTVIGVMPRGFQFPEGTEIWAPQGVGDDTIDRGVRFSNLLARLREGTSFGQAQAEMNAISARARSQNKILNTLHANASLTPLQDDLTAKSRAPLLLLLGAVACVLLIACANVANLALSRATNRQRELAVRSAIGARRSRLIRQLLVERVLVTLFGAAIGVSLAFATLRFLIAILPVALPKLTPIAIDGPVLAFTALLCGVASLLAGLVPAVSATQVDLSNPLKHSASMSAGRGHNRIRTALLVVQFAVSFVLLIGAGLMIRTLDSLLRVKAGFDASNVLTLNIPLSHAAYPAQPAVSAYYDQVFARLRSLPGVDSAGAINYLPLGGTPFFGLPISTPDHPLDENDPFHNVASFFTVAGDYFQAMRIPLLRGRYFSNQDGANGDRVAIINQKVARQFWPNRDAIGKRFETINQTFTIIGEVGDVRHASLQQSDEFEMYFPQTEVPNPVMDIVVRFAGNLKSMVPAVRSQILAVDKNQPIASVQTMTSVVDSSLSTPRSHTFLLGIFGLLALALATIGCYGAVAYSVAQRTHEIAIRIALGARSLDVLGLTISRGIAAAVAGIALGAAGAFALTRIMSSLLYGVTATDPLTFFAAAALLTVMAVAACYIPVRRAMHVDPMIALRHE